MYLLEKMNCQLLYLLVQLNAEQVIFRQHSNNCTQCHG